MTKGQYKTQYGLFDQALNNSVLKPPSKLDEIEQKFMPGSTEFQILNSDEKVLHHVKRDGKNAPVNILGNFNSSSSEIPPPNVKGVRWNYAKAIAQSLFEIEPDIEENLKKQKLSEFDKTLNTVIKDGGDGLGEVSVHKEKGDRYLPEKAFRFSFAIISSKCQLIRSGEKNTVSETKTPNSVRTNWPVLERICDENNKASLSFSLLPIEREREFLKDKVIKIKTGENKWREHKIKFVNSMIDEKHDRSISGYQGSGSRYICVLCHATHATCKSNLGTFRIDRS